MVCVCDLGKGRPSTTSISVHDTYRTETPTYRWDTCMCVPLEIYICVDEKCVSYSFHSFVRMATVMAYYVLYCIFIYKIQPIQKKKTLL